MFYPIILNATLIQPQKTLWMDWLPVIVSVFVVILGGFITYYVNIKLERDKRLFESRNQAYSEFLDTARKVKCFLEESKNSNPIYAKIYHQKGFDLINHDLSLARAKMCIFGSDKINEVVDKYYSTLFDTGNDMTYHSFEKELVAAIREEFSIREEAKVISWWQFWKRD
jgi:hypothetical protein